MTTPFGKIMRDAVEATPNAIGGSFAASDGEMVDLFTTVPHEDFAFLTAHYGVVLGHLESAFGTWHFGGPEVIIIEHRDLEVVIQPVLAGYFALLAMEQPAPLARAQAALAVAVRQLREQM